jgi:threonine aldolase
MLTSIPWVTGTRPIETNIVIAELREDLDAKTVSEKLSEIGILCFPFGLGKIRFVTHLDINDTHLDAFEIEIKKLAI